MSELIQNACLWQKKLNFHFLISLCSGIAWEWNESLRHDDRTVQVPVLALWINATMHLDSTADQTSPPGTSNVSVRWWTAASLAPALGNRGHIYLARVVVFCWTMKSGARDVQSGVSNSTISTAVIKTKTIFSRTQNCAHVMTILGVPVSLSITEKNEFFNVTNSNLPSYYQQNWFEETLQTKNEPLVANNFLILALTWGFAHKCQEEKAFYTDWDHRGSPPGAISQYINVNEMIEWDQGPIYNFLHKVCEATMSCWEKWKTF